MRFTEMPAFCSGCHGQTPDYRHIDFESYWDGPVLDLANGMKQCIDDLILCEQCVKEAAHMLGWMDAKRQQLETKRLQDELETAQQNIAKLERHSRALAAALQDRPSPPSAKRSTKAS